MYVALSVATALVLLLLALRLTQRLTLRFKLLAGVSVSRQPQKSCPHLGLSADPFSHDQRPSEDHRCYLWMQRDRIDLVHQKGFCLTTAHHKCPWLMIRRPDAPPPLRKRLVALPAATWGGLRQAPGLVMAAFTPSPAAAGDTPSPTAVGEGWGEGTHPSPRGRAGGKWRAVTQQASTGLAGATAGLAAAFASLKSASREATIAASPHVASGAARVGLVAKVAAIWSARILWQLLVLVARALWLLLRLTAKGIAWSARWARAQLALHRQRALQRKLALEDARVQAAVELEPEPLQIAAVEVPSPQPSPAAAGEGAGTSLAKIEELLAEGLATLDRGEEGLAYHIFVTASQQRAPRGASEAAYGDVMKRAWFWRAKTSETVEEVVQSLEQALHYEPANLQMQAQLAWARQRLEREKKLVPIEQSTPPPVIGATPAKAKPRWWPAIGTGVRMVGGLMALLLAALWMTTAVMPALGHYLGQLPAGDELLLRRLILTLNAASLPGHGHIELPMLNYDLGLALPFVMAFLFVFTARGLMDGDTWARTTGLCLAGVGGWLCAAAVNNPDASRLGLALCVGIIVAAVAGHFESPKSMHGWEPGY